MSCKALRKLWAELFPVVQVQAKLDELLHELRQHENSVLTH